MAWSTADRQWVGGDQMHLCHTRCVCEFARCFVSNRGSLISHGRDRRRISQSSLVWEALCGMDRWERWVMSPQDVNVKHPWEVCVCDQRDTEPLYEGDGGSEKDSWNRRCVEGTRWIGRGERSWCWSLLHRWFQAVKALQRISVQESGPPLATGRISDGSWQTVRSGWTQQRLSRVVSQSQQRRWLDRRNVVRMMCASHQDSSWLVRDKRGKKGKKIVNFVHCE